MNEIIQKICRMRKKQPKNGNTGKNEFLLSKTFNEQKEEEKSTKIPEKKWSEKKAEREQNHGTLTNKELKEGQQLTNAQWRSQWRTQELKCVMSQPELWSQTNLGSSPSFTIYHLCDLVSF